MIQTSFSASSLNAFVEQEAKDCLYYRQAWLDLINRIYGYSVIPLTTTNSNNQLTGFLPLCFIHSPLTGRHLASLPFSDHCPLLAVDESSANDLINQAISLARQQKVRYLELRTGVTDVLARRSDLAEGNLYVRWIVPLVGDPDIVWSNIGKTTRQQVLKSRKLGVQVRIAHQREDMLHYYRLHLQTRAKKHGMPAQPLRFFYELWDTFATSGMMRLFLAEYQGSVIAGTILLASGKTAHDSYSAANLDYLNLSPNHLVTWEIIKWCCMNGYQTYDMGRTATANEGLMLFKRRWGAIEEPLPYYYYPRIKGLAATSEHSGKYRLLTICWKHLPLQIAGPLGGYFYKYLG